ncbi:MAG: response regulator [bacterium]
MTATKIMIVDDNPKFLRELKESLELYGYRIICVQEGRYVLDNTLEQKPDLILLDLKMEGMSGLQIADILAHTSQTDCIPIIIMSAFWTNENMEAAMDLNEIKACLKKPFKVKQLIFEIEKVLK